MAEYECSKSGEIQGKNSDAPKTSYLRIQFLKVIHKQWGDRKEVYTEECWETPMKNGPWCLITQEHIILDFEKWSTGFNDKEILGDLHLAGFLLQRMSESDSCLRWAEERLEGEELEE